VGPDAILRRVFPVLVGALIALAAYLQVRGIRALVEAELAQHAPARQLLPAPRPRLPRRPDPALGLSAILARNPFDSVTGPLEARASATEAKAVRSTNPYEDPACPSGRVVVIAEDDDPTWTFAMIAEQGEKPRMRRVGDGLGRAVVGIARDRVWLLADGGRCQLRLGAPEGTGKPAPAPPQSQAPQGGHDGVAPEIAEAIHEINPRQFTVTRKVLDLMIAHEAEVMQTVRMTGVMKDGHPEGVKLEVSPGSAVAMLGLKTGDEVRALDGLGLFDPHDAVEAFNHLKKSDRISLTVLRDGRETTLDYSVR
jgi:general secretion pathway protein C